MHRVFFSTAAVRVAFAGLALAGLAAISTARAAEQMTYSPAAMKAAQEAGRSVVVDVTAPWCSTCAAQKPLVEAILAEPRFANLVLLHVDFDSQKKALRGFNVRAQSTFVAFKGRTEVGRSTGDTNRASIEKLFDKTS